jgi:hypothetical protein
MIVLLFTYHGKTMLMYAAVALWQKVGFAIVRTDLHSLCITGYISMAPTTIQEVLPGLQALNLLAQAR